MRCLVKSFEQVKRLDNLYLVDSLVILPLIIPIATIIVEMTFSTINMVFPQKTINMVKNPKSTTNGISVGGGGGGGCD